jgi:hypothetical protein
LIDKLAERDNERNSLSGTDYDPTQTNVTNTTYDRPIDNFGMRPNTQSTMINHEPIETQEERITKEVTRQITIAFSKMNVQKDTRRVSFEPNLIGNSQTTSQNTR